MNIEEDDLVQPVLDVGERVNNVHTGDDLGRKAHGFIVEQQRLARVDW